MTDNPSLQKGRFLGFGNPSLHVLMEDFGSKSQTNLGAITEWIISKKQKETPLEPEVIGSLQRCLPGFSVEIHTFSPLPVPPSRDHSRNPLSSKFCHFGCYDLVRCCSWALAEPGRRAHLPELENELLAQKVHIWTGLQVLGRGVSVAVVCRPGWAGLGLANALLALILVPGSLLRPGCFPDCPSGTALHLPFPSGR